MTETYRFLLTAAERERFASWLEFEAENGEKMAVQMATISVPEFMVKKERAEAMAAKVIAAKLRSIQEG
jgi:hypothetical protein